MKSSELLRRLRRIARQRGWIIEVTEGNKHTKVRLRGQQTVIPRHSSDLKHGTLRAILTQLDITAEDLEG